MDLENLIRLVSELSREQKKRLTNYLKERSRNLDYLLYTRILKLAKGNVINERVVRKKEFQDPSVFYKYRFRLAESIIRCKLGTSANRESAEFILAAYLAKMPKVGQKALFRGMQMAKKTENFRQLQGFYSLVDEMREFHNLKVEMPNGIWTTREFGRIMRYNLELRNLISKIKKGFSGNHAERTQTANAVESAIQAPAITKTNEELRTKAFMGIGFLKAEYDTGFRFGSEYLERIKSRPEKYPVAKVAKEMRVFIYNALILEHREVGMRYYFELAKLKPENLHEKDEILSSRIKIGVLIAELNHAPEVAESTLQLLREHSSLFEPDFLDTLFYSLAFSFFLNQAYSKSVKCLGMMNPSKAARAKYLSWEPAMLMAMCHFELETEDILDHLIGIVNRRVKTIEAKLPAIALSFFQSIANGTGNQHQLAQQAVKKQFEALLQDPDEKRAVLLLPIHCWFEAKWTGADYRSLIATEKRLDSAGKKLLRFA